MTIWHMRIACWITKAANTHSEYVMLLSFPQQQCLHKSASVLWCSYIDYFVFVCSCVPLCLSSTYCSTV